MNISAITLSPREYDGILFDPDGVLMFMPRWGQWRAMITTREDTLNWNISRPREPRMKWKLHLSQARGTTMNTSKSK